MNWLFPRKCPICGRASETVLCAECASEYPPQTIFFPLTESVCCHALYRYQGAVRTALHRFKFGGQRGYAEGFGLLMAQRLAEKCYDVVTFIPMDREKQARRGYNQAELLGKFCARGLHSPCRALLSKTRKTTTQHQLPAAARAQNVENAYQSVLLHGERVLICDDIVTTGSTLRSCAQALYRAGAGSVETICVAWSKGEL